MPTSSVGRTKVGAPGSAGVGSAGGLAAGVLSTRVARTRGARTHACSVHTRVNASSLAADHVPTAANRRQDRPCYLGPTSRGVTLVEMLIVVSIIGLIVAVSFPAFSAGIDSVRMSSATGMVSSFLNSAVNRAERRQQAVELIVTPKENLLTMYTNEPGFERKLKMPDGISIQAVLPAFDDEAPDSPRQLMLLPGATAPGIGILLANQHGSRRIVRLDPMTGFPRIESLDSESKGVAR